MLGSQRSYDLTECGRILLRGLGAAKPLVGHSPSSRQMLQMRCGEHRLFGPGIGRSSPRRSGQSRRNSRRLPSSTANHPIAKRSRPKRSGANSGSRRADGGPRWAVGRAASLRAARLACAQEARCSGSRGDRRRTRSVCRGPFAKRRRAEAPRCDAVDVAAAGRELSRALSAAHEQQSRLGHAHGGVFQRTREPGAVQRRRSQPESALLYQTNPSNAPGAKASARLRHVGSRAAAGSP
jgi:hypothetical protein